MKHHEVYKDGEDNGWLHKQNWWFDPDHELGFTIGDLDSLYPEKYFEVDHVKPETIHNYCEFIMRYFKDITGKSLREIVEFGTAGGWFGEEFKRRGIGSIWGLEGSQAGSNKASFRMCYNVLSQGDFRRPISYPFLSKRFDIALCTEVAEHIEPPFSATLVKSLCDASDLVWFSFEEPNTNPAHVHHCNEMPAKFWIHLFDFFGYGCYMLPDEVFNMTEGRGRMIFYNKNTYENNPFFKVV